MSSDSSSNAIIDNSQEEVEKKTIFMDSVEIRNFRRIVETDGLENGFRCALDFRRGGERWNVLLYKRVHEGKNYLKVCLDCLSNFPCDLVIKVFFCFEHPNGEPRNVARPRAAVLFHYDHMMDLSSASDEWSLDRILNDYTDKDGNMTYGLAIDVLYLISCKKKLKLWNFMDDNEEFYFKKHQFTFRFPYKQYLYADKRVLMRHSPLLAEIIQKGESSMNVKIGRTKDPFECFDYLLQMLHGSFYCYDEPDTKILLMLGAMDFAHELQFESAIRQCEQYWITENCFDSPAFFFKYDMPRLAKCCLGAVKNLDDMRTELRMCVIDMMSTRMLKEFARAIYKLRNVKA